MFYIIIVSSACLTFVVTILFYQFANQRKLYIKERLRNLTTVGEPQDAISAELSVPFSQRILRPLFGQLAQKIARLMPLRQSGLERQLVLAGQPGNFTVQEFVGLQVCIAFGFMAAGYLLAVLSGMRANIVLPISCGLAGFYLPKLYLRKIIVTRSSVIEKELPEVLDLLTVCVEAGLGFDAALAKVVEKSSTTLAGEFKRVLQEIKIGKPRREALKDLAKRLEVDDLSNFIGAVVQADQLGVSMCNMLRLQSQSIRQKRRQRIEEQAMKAPVKMLLPLVLFIFPCIFIVLLGPAVLQFIAAMGGR